MQKFISYVRVSTVRQGISGLGLEAQQAAITTYLKGATPLAEFVEVESGRNDDRPQLARALVACRQLKAVLVIAKLDRLARRVSFISNLMESGVEFTACDFPQANRLTLHILAAVAEHEQAMISSRTKAALQAAKTRGIKLGNPFLNDTANKVRVEQSDAFALKLKGTLRAFEAAGLTQEEMCSRLDSTSTPTPRGGKWSPVQLRRVLRRLDTLL